MAARLSANKYLEIDLVYHALIKRPGGGLTLAVVTDWTAAAAAAAASVRGGSAEAGRSLRAQAPPLWRT